jgi:hypothetical protein
MIDCPCVQIVVMLAQGDRGMSSGSSKKIIGSVCQQLAHDDVRVHASVWHRQWRQVDFMFGAALIAEAVSSQMFFPSGKNR